MTREEQIKRAGLHIISTEVHDLTWADGFDTGAKWSDENPKETNGKELLYVVNQTAERTKKELIKKACDWIQMNAERYMRSIGGCMYLDVINSVNDFKRAMEE